MKISQYNLLRYAEFSSDESKCLLDLTKPHCTELTGETIKHFFNNGPIKRLRDINNAMSNTCQKVVSTREKINNLALELKKTSPNTEEYAKIKQEHDEAVNEYNEARQKNHEISYFEQSNATRDWDGLPSKAFSNSAKSSYIGVGSSLPHEISINPHPPTDWT